MSRIDEEVRVVKGIGALLLPALRPSFKDVVEGGVYLKRILSLPLLLGSHLYLGLQHLSPCEDEQSSCGMMLFLRENMNISQLDVALDNGVVAAAKIVDYL